MNETRNSALGARKLLLSCGAVLAAITYWFAFHNHPINGIIFCMFCLAVIGAALALRKQETREKAFWILGGGAFGAAAVLIVLELAALQPSHGVGPWLWWIIGGGSMLVLAFDERRKLVP